MEMQCPDQKMSQPVAFCSCRFHEIERSADSLTTWSLGVSVHLLYAGCYGGCWVLHGPDIGVQAMYFGRALTDWERQGGERAGWLRICSCV